MQFCFTSFFLATSIYFFQINIQFTGIILRNLMKNITIACFLLEMARYIGEGCLIKENFYDMDATV